MKKETAIVALVLVAIAAFAAGWFATSAIPVGGPAEASSVGPYTLGSADAPIQIHEFSDFQCPFCGKAALGVLKEIKSLYPGQVAITFHHFPLRSHAQARPAASLAIAAGVQGRFWEMHDLLFKNRKNLSDETFRGLAAGLDLDHAALSWMAGDERVQAVIEEDLALARKLKVRGAPAFFINGKSLVGAQPLEAFKAIIDEQLAAAQAAGEQGVAPGDLHLHLARANGAPEAYIEHLVQGKPVTKKKKTVASPEKDLIPPTVWKVPLRPANPSIGPADAPLTVVVFSEFQCPYCHKGTHLLKELLDTYGDKVRIVFKHYPLPFHKQAFLAAEAAMAAHAQDRFWEMHDSLFEHRKTLSREIMNAQAAKLGLDMARFRSELDGHIHKSTIAKDQEEAEKLGVNSTPTFFFNGRKLEGARPLEALRRELDAETARGEEIRGAGIRNVHEHLTRKGKTFQPLDQRVHELDSEGTPGLGGSPDAPIQLTLFTDFQCPYCSRMAPVVEKVTRHYGQRARLSLRHFPLGFHKLARPAAIASLAAHEQDRFWEFHDKLFERPKELSEARFAAIARELGLDMARFEADRKKPELAERVDRDMQQGRKAGVRGTPTLFVNGRRYQSPGRSAAQIIKVIDKYFPGG